MICNVCNNDLDVSNFYFRKELGKYRKNCKKCKPINNKEAVAARTSKVCKICNENKPFSVYQKVGGGKWLQPYCKPCDAERKKQYEVKNKEKVLASRKRYYESNKPSIKIKQKEYTTKNSESVKERSKSYYDRNSALIKERARKYTKNNKESISIKNKKRREENKEYYKVKEKEYRNTPGFKDKKSEQDRLYRERNKEKVALGKKRYYALKGNEMAKAWQRKKMGNLEFRTKKRLRGRIYVALKRGVKSESTMNLLGCSIERFKNHFESLFTEGMNWDRYIDEGIHIDHIIPCKNFDLTKPDEQKKCFHYTNLQPLWAIDNLRKGVSILI